MQPSNDIFWGWGRRGNDFGEGSTLRAGGGARRGVAFFIVHARSVLKSLIVAATLVLTTCAARLAFAEWSVTTRGTLFYTDDVGIGLDAEF
ncbi:MAG: hypothetical protein L0Y39_02200 [Methylococcaceae bacterium]|nr:hypothetical protein [Methylococcaceae bacterium]